MSEIIHKKKAQYPGKKTVSLPDDTEKMWNELSKADVAVVDNLRPLIIDKVRALYAEKFGQIAL